MLSSKKPSIKLFFFISIILVLCISSFTNLEATTVTIGSGTDTNTNWGVAPVNISYRSLRTQTIYTASELNTAGMMGQNVITALAYYVTDAPAYSLPDFRIRMRHTSAIDGTEHIEGPYQEVYFNSSYMPTAGGWNVIELSTAFVWNGVDNILVDTAFGYLWSTTASGRQRIYSQTNGMRYAGSSFGDQTNEETNAVVNYKPQIQFTYHPLVLPVPQNLTAIPGSMVIYLNWEEPEVTNRERVFQLIGYNIYREQTMINLNPIEITEYADYDVLNDVTYEYYVTALYVEGESEPSNIVEVIPEPLPVPQNLTATSGNGEIGLAWVPPDYEDNTGRDRNLILLGYNVYRDWVLINSELVLETTYNDTDLVIGASYLYFVTAVYNVDESFYSNPVQVTALGGLYNLSVAISPDNTGSVSGDTGEIYAGQSITFEAIPEAGYDLINWTYTPDPRNSVREVFSTDNPLTFTMPENDLHLVANFGSTSGFAGGFGTAERPWEIVNRIHLNLVRNHLGPSHGDKHFRLMNNIWFYMPPYQDENWEPFGFYDIIAPVAFEGTFDGGSNTIYYLWIDRPNQNFIGLFGYVKNATIVDLNLSDALVTSGDYGIGTLFGTIEDSEIINCHVQGEVSGSYTAIGGLAGSLLGGTITGCSANVTVNGHYDTGGLIGEINSQGKVSESHSLGSVYGYGTVGGLAGFSLGVLESSYSESNVTASAGNTGGLAGVSAGMITQCYATGVISAQGNNVGGLVGYSTGNIYSSFATGNVTATVNNGFHVGGLVGSQYHATGARFIINSHSTGTVNGYAYAGGLVGKLENGQVLSSYSSSSVSGSLWLGGLVGLMENGVIERSYALGNIPTAGGLKKGGLVGEMIDSEISNSYARGNINGSPELGGLIGVQDGGSVTNSYSTGTLPYSTTGIGGLIGAIDNDGIVNSSYWDTEASNIDQSAGGVGRSTSDMTQPYNFDTTFVNWDFINIWQADLNYDINNGYPYLNWQGGYFQYNPPLNLIAEAGDGVVDLFWDPPEYDEWRREIDLIFDNAGSRSFLGYNVYRNNNLINQDYIADSEYTDETVINGTTYYYYVTVVYSAFESLPSNTDYATPQVTTYTISMDINPPGAGTVTGYESEYEAGEEVTLEGFPGTGWQFISWTYQEEPEDIRELFSTDNPVIFVMPAHDLDLVANFEEYDYFSGGDGSEANPWEIRTPEELNAMRHYTSEIYTDKHFILMADIDLNLYPYNEGAGWEPIGNFNNNNTQNAFWGHFDGNSHTISNLYINRPTTNDVGLLGRVRDSNISNLSLVNVSVTGNNRTGGLIGNAQGTGYGITNCYVNGSVTGNQRTGGVIGSASEIDILDCRFWGMVTGDDNYIGGLGGYLAIGGIIDNSFSIVIVSGIEYVGGLIGLKSSGAINNCYASGSVNGVSRTGGLVGRFSSTTISNSYSNATVAGDFYIGGFAGSRANSSLVNCYAIGYVDAPEVFSGGLIGVIDGTGGTITSSYWNFETTGLTGNAGDGFGRTTDEMTHPYADNTYVGWDLTDIWVSDESYQINQGYPYLFWQDDSQNLTRPLNLSGNSSYGEVNLSWSAPDNISRVSLENLRENPVLLGYNVYRDWLQINDEIVENELFSDPDVLPGDNYLYFVTAVYDQGESNPSNLYEIRALGDPVNLTVIAQPGFAGSVAGYEGDLFVGQEVTLEAIPNYGYQFLNWSFVEALRLETESTREIFSTDNPVTFLMPEEDLNLIAYFGDTSGFSGGFGTSESPWEIRNRTELDLVRNYLGPAHGDKHFKLMNDLWFSSPPYHTLWESIGYYDIIAPVAFEGTFDGGGYLITNLIIESPYDSYVGLFGYVKNAFIFDLNLSNANVTGGNYGVGVLFGTIEDSEIVNCHVQGEVSGSYTAIGGLAGSLLSGTITGCTTDVTVDGHYDTGGLVGMIYGQGRVSESNSSGMVSGYSSVGGLAGFSLGVLESSHSSSGISATNGLAGGLVGQSVGLISQCYATGAVQGEGNSFGGLVGGSGGNIYNSYATGNVSTLYNNWYVGGLIGNQYNDTIVINCYATGVVNGDMNTGGLIGRLSTGEVTNSYSISTVTGEYGVGGLVGHLENGRIERCYALGSLNVLEGLRKGGLVGIMTDSQVSNSYARVPVNGFPPLGGLIGFQDGGSLTNSYSTGSLPYSVEGIGGLIGEIDNDGIVNYSYWDIDSSDIDVSAGGEGRSTSEMIYPYALNTYQGWDFADIWLVDTEGNNDGYPYLIWQEGLDYPPPLNLVALPGDGFVDLSWEVPVVRELSQTDVLSDMNQRNFLGYNIYRNNVVINQDIVTETQYTDYTVVNGTIYRYYITAIYTTGESIPSNIELTTPEATTYIVSVDINPAGAGSVTGSDLEYEEGVSVTLEAFPGTGWQFTNWTYQEAPEDMREMFSTDNPVIFSMPANDLYLTANFEEHNYFSGGDGSADNPWEIRTTDELNSIRHYIGQIYADQHFILMADIDLNVNPYNEGGGWEPIGNYNNNNIQNLFYGHLDGNDHHISNLYINRPSTDDVGLFGRVRDSHIRNISISNSQVTGRNNTGSLIGNYSGLDYGEVANVYGTGLVSGNENTGGLIGRAYRCYLNDSSFWGSVAGSSYTGGLVGYALSAQINGCYAAGYVEADNRLGGLVGVLGGGTLQESYALAEVSGEYYGGGLVGVRSNGTITRCYAIGNVVVPEPSGGGLVGSVEGSTGGVNDSYWNIETSGQTISAGGTGKNTEDMTYPYDIQTYVGWDFSEVWQADETYIINNGYPYLNWQDNIDLFTRPADLVAITANGTVSLSWDSYLPPARRSGADDRNDPVFIGYNVYRNWSQINIEIITEAVYTDEEVAIGNLYHYFVTAVYDQGESLPSNLIQIRALGESVYLTVSANPDFAGNIVGETENIRAGQLVSLEALPQGNAVFVNWTASGNLRTLNHNTREIFSNDNPLLFLMPENDLHLTANFRDDTGFAAGFGMEEYPWEITNITQLNLVREYIGPQHSDKHFRVMNNLWFFEPPHHENWEPIGFYDLLAPSGFQGYFDGNNYTIHNLYVNINDPTISSIGLFGYLENATVKDLSIVNASISGYYNIAGTLAGIADNSTIVNCHVQGVISTIERAAGGLIGSVVTGTITGSSSIVNVTGDDDVGGLIGMLYAGGSVTDSYSNGTVSGYSYVGGLIGHSLGAVSSSYSEAQIWADNGGAGGLIGESAGNINECYATGDVSGEGSGFGGLVGNSGSNIFDSYATGNVTATENDGWYVGGLVGYQYYEREVVNCHASGSVTGYSYTGGLIGRLSSSHILNSHSTSSATGLFAVGGLVGRSYSAHIEKSYALGTIMNYGGTRSGGLVGMMEGGEINDCYARGTVEGTWETGGLVGWIDEGTVANSYATGALEGFSDTVGGLIGFIDNEGLIFNSYWDMDTTTKTQSAGGEGRTTSEMTYPYAANTYQNWDFESVWGEDVNHQINNGYPYLIIDEPPMELDPPYDVTIGISDGMIILSWSEVEGANGYIIEASWTPYGDYNDISSSGTFTYEAGIYYWSIAMSEPYLFFRIRSSMQRIIPQESEF
ncbi:MAG: hypothetical protein K0B81_04065 [Candidatus Cloacimonetes bacterium]|nr:hypothetical protein [Candidatus Cloacimonadota bacterium]